MNDVVFEGPGRIVGNAEVIRKPFSIRLVVQKRASRRSVVISSKPTYGPE
jgi:hypothetical protein